MKLVLIYGGGGGCAKGNHKLCLIDDFDENDQYTS